MYFAPVTNAAGAPGSFSAAAHTSNKKIEGLRRTGAVLLCDELEIEGEGGEMKMQQEG